MANVKTIPTSELLSDRQETLADIHLCRYALTKGISTYFDGQEDVRERLHKNVVILHVIDRELKRREQNV